MLRVLLVADTHLGFDQPRRPRSDRPRRGADFFANLEHALAPARAGEVDCVVHAGDLLYRSKVAPELVRAALEPLLRVADRGIPVFLVPGNHERSTLPYPLLGLHESLHVFYRPATLRVRIGDVELAAVGLPCQRHDAAAALPGLIEQADDGMPADLRLLLIHQTVEGARVGPGSFVFRSGRDVVPGRAIPPGYPAVLAGHIHRHQVLTHDLAGRPLAAPVFYPGSIERTSFAEEGEQKGLLIIDFEPDRGCGGRLRRWTFHPLPTRPMVTMRIAAALLDRTSFARELAERLAEVPPRAVVRIRIVGPLPAGCEESLRVANLRCLAPAHAIVSLRLDRAA